MAYCIMRVEKRRRADVVGIQREANRTEENRDKGWFQSSDIDWDKTKDNVHFKKTDEWNRAITGMLKSEGIKPRKDAIVLLDGLYAVSGEWLAEHTEEEAEQYFRDCIKFHIEEYCCGENSLLLNAVLHKDEGEWHMQVASIPLIYDQEKGRSRLSAKEIMGNRKQYSERQDRFWEAVGRERGLERGDKTKEQDAEEYRRHITKREYEKKQLEDSIRSLYEYIEKLELEHEKAVLKMKKLFSKLDRVKTVKDAKGFSRAVAEIAKEVEIVIKEHDSHVRN